MHELTPPMSESLQRAFQAVEHYDKTYRHPALRRLEVSGLYALHPEEPGSLSAEYRWPHDPWPLHDRPGVYLIFDRLLDLRYIGRAHVIGRRLADYFATAADGSCRLRHSTWRSAPSYLMAVAVERTFEAGALEEFLIGKLDPAENSATHGQDPATW